MKSLTLLALLASLVLGGCGKGADEAPPKVEGTVPVVNATGPAPGPGGTTTPPPGDGK